MHEVGKYVPSTISHTPFSTMNFTRLLPPQTKINFGMGKLHRQRQEKTGMTQVSLVDPNVRTFIEQRAKDTLYYNRAWLDLITQLYGYSLIPLIATNTSGQLTGFLPLC